MICENCGIDGCEYARYLADCHRNEYQAAMTYGLSRPTAMHRDCECRAKERALAEIERLRTEQADTEEAYYKVVDQLEDAKNWRKEALASRAQLAKVREACVPETAPPEMSITGLSLLRLRNDMRAKILALLG